MTHWIRPAAVISVVLLVCVGCATLGGRSTGGTGKLPVLMIAQEGSEDINIAVINEAGRMIDMLSAAGYKVVVATESGKPLVAEGRTITPQIQTAAVRTEDYCGLIMPSMNAESTGITSSAVSVVKQMAAQGKPIAAQRGSVGALADAGLLEGLEYSADWMVATDGQWVPNSVVQVGRIITSGGCPYSARFERTIDGTEELTEGFIVVLSW